MPTRRELYEQIAERNLREQRADDRERRWFWVRSALWLWLWAGCGLVLGGWAFHVTDVEFGRTLLLAGALVTLVGFVGTVWRAVVVARDRGWL